MDRIARIYQRLVDAVPANARERTGCVDIVLFVMMLTGQKTIPVTLEALSEHFPNRDYSASVLIAIDCELLEIDLHGDGGIVLGSRALDVLRDEAVS